MTKSYLLSSSTYQMGFAGLGILLIFLILIGLLMGLDYGYIYYSEHCEDRSVPECVSELVNRPPVSPTQATKDPTMVVATGNKAVSKYKVSVALNIPLGGGPVNGDFSGDCEGSVTGTYDSPNHSLSGKAVGSCSPLLVPVPASATFTGQLFESQKTVDITGTGGAMGYTGTGNLTLTF